MSNIDSPIALSELESVLAWVDTFKLSRPTKKINRDFSDAVLLAEILSVHYPKLVEMHNYPPRNSHSLKLNNWLTLNRKVLKKLRLSLCCNTMDQLANCAPGVIERVLVMVRDKIRRDEELNKSMRESEQNVSSGGSYYEACGEDENILVVPVKTRVNGVLETVQQKVVNYDCYLTLKEEFKDAKDSIELLKQKVEHLDNLLKLKEERIEELQKQLERKQNRRREVEALQNSLSVPFDEPPTPTVVVQENKATPVQNTIKNIEAKTPKVEESKIPILIDASRIPKPSVIEVNETAIIVDSSRISKPITKEVYELEKPIVEVHEIKSDVFKETEVVEQKSECFHDVEDFDQNPVIVTTIEESINKEIKEIVNSAGYVENFGYVA
ncbi:sperm flagellar protein 1-like [Bombyx mandarina]|uniref:Sperm flagellar protein 1-like n=1 Tax=Bombyx mandarina TaxID=7092 RepID=A0A6J2JFK1_BOMMA|nr:sperm flagellar protein 1-like [Bombyx mandarina]